MPERKTRTAGGDGARTCSPPRSIGRASGGHRQREGPGPALLILATPRGPTCHTGSDSCFGDDGAPGTGFIATLADTVASRASADPATSYTARLIGEGVKRLAQKVGEEGVEVALAATSGDADELTAETADLIYHLTVLLEASGSSWDAVVAELKRRHAPSPATASS